MIEISFKFDFANLDKNIPKISKYENKNASQKNSLKYKKRDLKSNTKQSFKMPVIQVPIINKQF